MARPLLMLVAHSAPVDLRAAEMRTWTDKTGQFHVKAELVTHQGDTVWLRRADGETFEIQRTELSTADQRYIRKVIREGDVATAATANPPGRIPYGPGRKLGELADERIDESSGLACSRQSPGIFWTHNDSGGDARLFAVDTRGRTRGTTALAGVVAYDWEDIASFRWRGKNYLLVCDVGNNGRAAAVQILYWLEEPRPGPDPIPEKVPMLQTIFFSYEDDHRDCEAVAVDPTDRTVLLVTKQRDVLSYVYALPWPKPAPDTAFVARRIATIPLSLVTAMDISPDGLRAVVATYQHAYEYVRSPGTSWKEAFAQPPRQIVLPRRVQGESICYGQDGKTLYLTSEKRPTPLWEIPVLKPQP